MPQHRQHALVQPPRGPCSVRSESVLIGRVGQHGGDPGPAPLQHVITIQDGPLGIALDFAEAPRIPLFPPPPPTGSEILASLEDPVATDLPSFTALLSGPHPSRLLAFRRGLGSWCTQYDRMVLTLFRAP
ncbi:hypothetical protein CORC01_08244 [Colletotrichum orchidophilum]|uniref:Uncharacterized protein n=1 Tax=Colletotrichum orchidophilum TaxID=1209926 RepID=A0A1G4B4Z5_9PEZI|nr:uncharacterized protein CORC01_08244 [Colletotrichum orchidophilum]OHE96481.1 hypothetical protein CORC01_08244 [Colletotrichum orchidophilum]